MKRNRYPKNSAYVRLLARYRAALAENAKLKAELEEAETVRQNYWKHIVWLRTPENEEFKPKAKPCPICGSECVGLDGSAGSRAFFVWCGECEAMGPECDGEAKAILAWNEASAEDLTVFEDDEEATNEKDG